MDTSQKRPEMGSNHRSRASSWMPAAVVAVISFASGGWLIQQGAASQEGVLHSARLFDDVHRYVAERYVEEIDPSELYRMAIDGLLEEVGDPYSTFIDAADRDDFTLQTTGNYGGLGIRIRAVGDWVTVMSVLPNTPAERQGLQTGDKIMGVEGESARGWTDEQAVERLRGEKGEPVTIAIGRFGVDEPLEFTIVRDRIHVEATKAFMITPEIGFVRLEQFSQRAEEEVANAVNDLRDQGARKLILDLRGNPGGLLTEGIAVSDLFLSAGEEIVSVGSRNPNEDHIYRAPSAEAWPEIPLVVLISETSASASEIVAGALQDHDRALVLGVTTFGKGSVQSLINLEGGHQLKLTTAAWFTPSGRSITVPRDRDEPELDLAVHAEADTAGREIAHTDSGRPVYGGGGIRPDLTVREPEATEEETDFLAALAQAGVPINNVAIQVGVSWAKEHPGLDPDFEVTEELRSAYLAALQEAAGDEPVTATEFNRVRRLVDRILVTQVANAAFGETAMLRRNQLGTRQIEEAVRLLQLSENAPELFAAAEATRAEDREAVSAEAPEREQAAAR
ncbi:MAG: S41 family peptidase [Gemmatimonadota bacterium]